VVEVVGLAGLLARLVDLEPVRPHEGFDLAFVHSLAPVAAPGDVKASRRSRCTRLAEHRPAQERGQPLRIGPRSRRQARDEQHIGLDDKAARRPDSFLRGYPEPVQQRCGCRGRRRRAVDVVDLSERETGFEEEGEAAEAVEQEVRVVAAGPVADD
jgi:hypothetical protein